MNTLRTATRRFQTSASTAVRGAAGLSAMVLTVALVSGLSQLADGYQADAVMASRGDTTAVATRLAQQATQPAADVQRVVITASGAAVRG